MTPDHDRTRPPPADDLTRLQVDDATRTVERAKDQSTVVPESSSAAPDVHAPPGFVVERELGVGGMGVVYLARQTGLNRPVALKVVKGGTTVDAKALIRFLAEAEAVASIRHPNVVEVYSYGEHAGKPYMALEFCPGGDLTTLSKAEQTRDATWFRRVADLMAKIADGVNAAHGQGIVHRDLKPANVLLTADGTPKVTDFGLAKRGLGSDLTHTGAILGTPAYMAPEQASGRTKFVGLEADVWALGVMLYELLCGQRPFDGSTPLEVMAAVAKADVPMLRDRFPTVPTDLALVAHKCLSADPRDRYPTAGALASDLRNWLDGKPVSARPTGVIESAVKWVRRNKRVALIGLGVLLVMTTATAVSLGFGVEADKQREKAEGSAKRADNEKNAAIAARDDLAKANEKTERALARGFLDKFELTGRSGWAMRDFERLHWELLEVSGQPLGRYILEEATTRPRTYGAQTDFFREELIHAVVGLNRQRREEFDHVFTRRMQDRQSLPVEKAKVGLAIHDGYWTGPSLHIVDAMFDAWARSDQVQQAELVDGWFICLALQPSRAEEVLDLVSQLLLQNSFTADKVSLGTIVARACEHVPRQHAEVTCLKLVQRLAEHFEKSADKFTNPILAQTISTLVRWLPAVEAEQFLQRVAALSLRELRSHESAGERVSYAESLHHVCRQLPPEQSFIIAAEANEILTTTPFEESSEVQLSWRISALNSIYPYLSVEAKKALTQTRVSDLPDGGEPVLQGVEDFRRGLSVGGFPRKAQLPLLQT